MTDDGLIGYTVFARPLDFPGVAFVVRPWCVFGAPRWPFVRPMATDVPNGYSHQIACLCDSLEDARAPFLGRLARIARHSSDDPVIFEVWI